MVDVDGDRDDRRGGGVRRDDLVAPLGARPAGVDFAPSDFATGRVEAIMAVRAYAPLLHGE